MNYNSVNPSHYHRTDRETIEKMLILFGGRAVKDFCKVTAFKYYDRAGLKEGVDALEDYEKADWYITVGGVIDPELSDLDNVNLIRRVLEVLRSKPTPKPEAPLGYL